MAGAGGWPSCHERYAQSHPQGYMSGLGGTSKSWICATGKKLINDLIMKQFPLLLLDNNRWKLELLCTNNYPWCKNNLGLDRSWKDMSTKLAAKEEDLDNEANLLHSKGKGKRCLSDSSECHDDQCDIKKSRNNSTSTTISTEEKVCPIALPTLVCGTSLLLHQDPKPSPVSTVNLLSPIDLPLPLQDLPGCVACEKSAVPFGVYLLQPTPQGSLVSHNAHGTNKENKFVLKDPLANIFGPNGMARTVPEPALSPIKKPNDGSSTKVPKKKMHPGSAKNVQNLCALRWLKQVKMASSTTDEFSLYWAALTSAQQDKYKADMERLQSAGTWTKGSNKAICDGTMY
ncbi:uncharacterized protein BJ212DRAFT_1303226 [Suillus subaureus]|uniref:Uncharacterized protein n=1 Tax=Suillus subaureus TaxID=48587 RepID=A0A9P7J8D3_9AGAM|nr:uncharacterized protein BJ212DRAFT_1303226 [Suillus subaureus]KAG1808041.1 hypothetical protein BJ212DRAFT_1303226 [Suillus subaureus]